MSVASFMDLALGHPEFGYYQTRDPFGAAGDFITAPDVSQVFGELLGLWLATAWHEAGKPTPFRLVELGPGRGQLMADVIRVAAKVPGFLEGAEHSSGGEQPAPSCRSTGDIVRYRDRMA